MSPHPDQGRPLVTLTTDFGTADGYVGAIKGRLLSLAPPVRICDISHQVAPRDVVQGAWCLKRAAPRFPDGAIHLAVIDPGVGSARAGLVVVTERFLLVGPDNGVLSLAAREGGLRQIVTIGENPPHWQKSASFDGLTLFAPVAARLAMGDAPEMLGQPAEAMEQLPQKNPRHAGDEILGEVLFFDRFGNAVTNITVEDLAGKSAGRVMLGAGEEAQWATHYAAMAKNPGCPAAIWNSDGHLELALFGGSLKNDRRIRAGERVAVSLRPAAG
ncbi:MAG: SAM-dependent chlorinase/fluorinase [bacterium]